MNRKLTVSTLLMAMSIAFVGIANAQDTSTTNPPPQFEQGHRGFGFAGTNSEIILSATGLTADELHDALQAGSTVAELITANGGDVDAVIADLVAEQTERITQNQSDRLTNLEDQITAMVNGDLPTDDFGGFGGRGMGFAGANSETILTATGLTADELHDALQSGSTVAELITANDGDVDAIIADLVAQQTEHIDQMVTDERITQEQADTMIANLESQISDMLNGTAMPPMNDGQGFNRGGFGGRGGGFPGGAPNGRGNGNPPAGAPNNGG